MASDVEVAWVGVASGAVGGSLALCGTFLRYWLDQRERSKLEAPRRKLLKAMLEDEQYKWRELSTLSHVIGADEATAKRLLLEIGARASEDGQGLWGLITRNPLPAESHRLKPGT